MTKDEKDAVVEAYVHAIRADYEFHALVARALFDGHDADDAADRLKALTEEIIEDLHEFKSELVEQGLTVEVH